MEVAFESVRIARGGRLVLEVPALAIADGRVTALLGPNGSGKSSLLRAIAALDPLASGSIRVGGVPVRADRQSREKIAIAFQQAVFVGGSVRENLELGLKLRKVPAEERRLRIQAAARALNILDLLPRRARNLSGGEAQRVNLARALALRAPVTLLDEPLSGLDAPSREQALRDLPGILRATGDTVVVVTHDRDEAARLADDVVLLLNGRVLGAGRLREVFARPPGPEAAAFLGWTVFPEGGGMTAIAPDSLSLAEGDEEFEFEAQQSVPAGPRWDVLGAVNGSPARITGLDAPPGLSRMRAWASESAVVRYPLRERESSGAAEGSSLTGRSREG